MADVSGFDQRTSRWTSFTDNELVALYSAVFSYEDDSIDLDVMLMQMRNEIARRCEQEESAQILNEGGRQLIETLKMRAAGK